MTNGKKNMIRWIGLKKLRHLNIHYVGSNDAFLSEKKHRERNRNTDRKKYLLEFAGGFVIQVEKFHANSLNKFIRVYLSEWYFNAFLKAPCDFDELSR